MAHEVLVKQLGLSDYLPTWQAMQDFTRTRSRPSASQLWVVEHPSVFTQGQAGKAEHLLNPEPIPVIQTDRGGQVTYHGPGQLVIYPLLDLHALHIGVRSLVTALETSVIKLLAAHHVEASARRDAPGVYVDGKKIAALGLRIRRGFSYHGLSLNVDMDLAPFARINPCGYQGLQVTQLKDEGVNLSVLASADALLAELAQELDLTFIQDHD